MKTFRSYTEVSACVGQEVAVTDWIVCVAESLARNYGAAA